MMNSRRAREVHFHGGRHRREYVVNVMSFVKR